MKLIFSFIMLLMLNKECNQKHSNPPETLASQEVLSNQEEKSLQFTYRVHTRGFFEILWLTKDSITLSKDIDLVKTESFNYPEQDWQELMTLLHGIDVKNLPNLEAPSQMHRHDAAAMTTLKVTIDEEAFETPIFDNGNPPKTIEAIVNKLLSIKSLVEKR